MNKNNKTKYKVINSAHLNNIFEKDYYLELGIIDVDIIRRILNGEVIEMNQVAYLPIQNKGLGHGNSEDEVLKENLPYYFFRKYSESNALMQLVITYGLCYYRDYEKKDKFVPIILIPITMFYENNKTYIRMISRPFENPALQTIFENNPKMSNKLQLTQSEPLIDIYALDMVTHTLEKAEQGILRLDSYLTFVEKKREEIIFSNKKKFDEDNRDNINVKQRNIFYSRMLTREQKDIVLRAYNGANITFTGFNGTGKTTTLGNIVVNAINNKQKVLYLTNSLETINDVKNFLCEVGLNNYYYDLHSLYEEIKPIKDINPTREEDIKNLSKKLKENYDYLYSYEKEMSKMVYDFKFVEAIEKLFLIKKFDKVEKIDYSDFDNLDFLYKNEYMRICEALTQIEEYSQHIESFKDSVWNEIPYINNIKQASEVLSIVLQLNDGLKKLKEKVCTLEKFGIKKITSFSGVKRVLEPIEQLELNNVPLKWLSDYSVFVEAREMQATLQKRIEDYQNLEYDLSTKYLNLNHLNINKEIETIYNDFFTEDDEEIINDIIKDLPKLRAEADKTRAFLEEFKNNINAISQIMDWNFFEKDISINDINNLTNLYLKHNISGKQLAMIMNNKDGQTLSKLEEINDSITSLTTEINNAFTTHPKLHKWLKNKTNNQAVINYNQLEKKFNKLEKDYQEIADCSYVNHKEVIETIRDLKKYYSNIMSHGNRKKIIDFILSINKNNRKPIDEVFEKYVKMYRRLNEEVDKYQTFGFSFDDKIATKLAELEKYVKYIADLTESQKRLLASKVNNKSDYILVSEYYNIKNIQEDFDTIVNDLRTNEEFKRLFEFLYEGETTDYKSIIKIIKEYESFMAIFITPKEGIEALKDFSKIRILADSMNSLVTTIGGHLHSYSLKFKDSVSRYYFSNIEQNIEYLNSLIESKEELTYYLKITKGLKVLYEYNLQKLIEFIVTKDKVYNLVDMFSYIYFKNIITRDIEQNEILKDTCKYIDCMKDTIETENKLCKAYGNNIISRIRQNNSKQIKSGRMTLNKAKVILSTVQLADEELKGKSFDLVIIDDAHLITDGKLENIFKGNQIIVCGDYQTNKVVNQNLISIVSNKNTDIFRNRLILGPRKLTYHMANTKSPYLSSYNANKGIIVINENIEEYIYKLYLDNKNVKINYFLKYADSQYQSYEKIAKYFYYKNTERDEIIRFLNEGINIIEMEKSNYIHSDYDIIKFEDYYKENSPIITNNYLERIITSRKGLVIFDEHQLLAEETSSLFSEKIKEMLNNEIVFLKDSSDNISTLIYELLKQKGYEVYYPSNGINLTVKKKDSDEIVSIIILYSNGFVSGVLNNYRFLKEIYAEKGHKLIIKTMIDLIKGPYKLVKELCEEIDG